MEEAYRARLQAIEAEAAMPFNSMANWGANGRIVASAPALSPFIRHWEKLEIG